MDEKLLETVLARATGIFEEGVAFVSNLTAEHLTLVVAVLIWIQLVRLTAAMSNVKGLTGGDQRVRTLEGEVKQLSRELHSLNTYVTSSTGKTSSDTR